MNQVLGKLEILMTRGKIGHSESERIRKKKNGAMRLVRAALELIPCCISPHALKGYFNFFY